MNQRGVPKQVRATYQAKIAFHHGTGPLKDWPWGSSVSYRGRNYIVSGFDGGEGDEDTPGPIQVRLVNRLCSVELRGVDPEDLTKTVAPRAWQR